MISEKIKDLLEKREFISIATCDFSGRPNVVPQFFLKIENKSLYLVDYVRGRTFENLKINPRVSVSLMDLDNLIGYQLNGSVEIISEGKDYDALAAQLQDKEVSLSTQRIIEGVDRGKTHSSFEVGLSGQIVIFKVKIEEAVEINPRGELKREKV
jgi:predicted pyridoxine 5'-phosphate oxidase superfamily flavin-nucleotide-binding protein